MRRSLMLAAFCVLYTGNILEARAQVPEPLRDNLTYSMLDGLFSSAKQWKLNDTARYRATTPQGPGTVVERVIRDTGSAWWVRKTSQVAGTRTVMDTLINKADGRPLRQLRDGVELPIPPTRIEMLETREEKITVPAGTFDATYLLATMYVGFYSLTYEVWSNTDINLLEEGALKISMDYPGVGLIVLELIDFKRAR